MKVYVLLLILGAMVTARVQSQSNAAGESADRLAIRELIDAYGHDADNREAEKQAALFTPDGMLENIHMEPGQPHETTILRGRKDLAAGFATLKKFEVTMHFNGQCTIHTNGDSASAETYCLAHHIWVDGGRRVLMIIGIRYEDTMIKINGAWLFAKRQLYYLWVDRRSLNP